MSEGARAAGATNTGRMRLDKWLWAARFFKTRPLAVEAITGGKVQVDGQRVKPGRAIAPGARLTIHKGQLEWQIEVLGLCGQRRPASEAVTLYAEDEESRLRRQELTRERREAGATGIPGAGRPTKRDRRQIHRFTSTQQD
jgi:ribosome-associated heat shock protein Hsp15